jgi:phosphatidate phosphatase APP1
MAEDSPSGWRARLGRIASDLRSEIERAGASLGLTDDDRPYEITPYRGYGTRSRVLVHGRVIEARNIAAATETDSIWRNLINTYKRIDSDPLGGARVSIRVEDREHEVVADGEGFFRQWVELASPLEGDEQWREVELQLEGPVREGQPAIKG